MYTDPIQTNPPVRAMWPCNPGAPALVLVLALLWALAGCTADTVAPASDPSAGAASGRVGHAAKQPTEPFEAELCGYRALAGPSRAEPVALLDSGALPRVRLAGVQGVQGWRLSWEASGQAPADFGSEATRRGRHVLVTATAPPEPPPRLGAGRLLLRDATGVRGAWAARWGRPPAQRPELQAAVKARADQDKAAARAALRPALEAADAELRYWAHVELARLTRMDRPAGEVSAVWERAAALAPEAGLLTEQARCLRVAAFFARKAHRFDQALRLLDAADRAREGLPDPLGAVLADYWRGVLSLDAAEYREALRLLDRARDGAWSRGMVWEWASGVDVLSQAEQALGRHRRAKEVLESVSEAFGAAAVAPNLRVAYHSNFCWLLLEGAASGALPTDWSAAERHCEQALRDNDFEQATRAATLANLAWAALLQRRTAECRQRIAQARQAAGPALTPRTRRFLDMLEAELLLRDGRPGDALARYRDLVRVARHEAGGGDTADVWKALHGQGRALAELGKAAQALVALREALTVLQRLGQRAPIQEHRAAFFAGHRQIVETTVDLLLAEGEYRGALQVADAAQAHVLRSLEAKTRVERLPAAKRREWVRRYSAYRALRSRVEELAQRRRRSAGPARRALDAELSELRTRLPAAFEEAVGYLERATPLSAPAALGATSWDSLLKPGEALLELVRLSGGGWHVFWMTAKGLEHSASAVANLAPWIAARLRGVRHLYVVSGGSEAAWQLNAAELPGGALLAERVGLTFLPYAGWLGTRPAPASGPALLAGDPGGDLPGARAELATLAERFGGSTQLLGAAVTSDAVLAALSGASLFHFAGHGVLHTPSPWDAHLRLAGRERLTVADLFLAQPSVGLVVLSSCEVGGQRSLSPWEALGLPAVFLAAGARAVLAADRAVDDGQARQFLEWFYAAGGAQRPTAALRVATGKAREAHMDVWTAFRLAGRPSDVSDAPPGGAKEER